MTTAIVSTPTGFRIDGHVGFHNVVVLRKAGESLLTQLGTRGVTIDLSTMQDDCAVTLSLLLCWLRTAKRYQQKIILQQVPPSLKRMASLFGLAEFF